MKIYIAILALVLSGCQACRTHPIACTAIGAVIVGSVAATLAHNPSGPPPIIRGCAVIGSASRPGACP